MTSLFGPSSQGIHPQDLNHNDAVSNTAFDFDVLSPSPKNTNAPVDRTFNDIEMEMKDLELLDLPIESDDLQDLSSEEINEFNDQLNQLKDRAQLEIEIAQN